MKKENSIILFNQKQVRRHWDNEKELWYFSIVDVIASLTHSQRPRKYWSDLKKKLEEEGSELSEKIGQLKMKSIILPKNWTSERGIKNMIKYLKKGAGNGNETKNVYI